ncbi:multidrug transporter MatE [Algimonas ampicilliniresistens]|uniref:Multidrug transporter MatE n=1 Tax=Algimonas ampicilliniresistens TaxID=1298735 RepID=A0ABQ5VC65_9PROT|nr:AbrB/MazE/SpoVT family DNA-binding domain-containing protein [Algimonas ampicilliniresistens]GLQ25121.1 multidrug transporter MatE [Algimonas ampicilliniresistens]
MQTIKKWGNSLAVRIPTHIALQARLTEGAHVAIDVDDNGEINIKPQRPRFKLTELLADYQKPEDDSAEIQWGELMGEEII